MSEQHFRVKPQRVKMNAQKLEALNQTRLLITDLMDHDTDNQS